jgi:DNA-binding XRE family transcriptional regulator
MLPFPLALRMDRQRRRLTQQELADALGTLQQSITAWERGTSVPRKQRREQIVEFFGPDSEVAKAEIRYQGIADPDSPYYVDPHDYPSEGALSKMKLGGGIGALAAYGKYLQARGAAGVSSSNNTGALAGGLGLTTAKKLAENLRKSGETIGSEIAGKEHEKMTLAELAGLKPRIDRKARAALLADHLEPVFHQFLERVVEYGPRERRYDFASDRVIVEIKIVHQNIQRIGEVIFSNALLSLAVAQKFKKREALLFIVHPEGDQFSRIDPAFMHMQYDALTLGVQVFVVKDFKEIAETITKAEIQHIE